MSEDKKLESITICISSNPRWEFLAEGLESIRSQEYDLEKVTVIVPMRAADRLILQDRLLDYSMLNIQTPEIGENSAATIRNYAIDKAKSDILYFLDEDCAFSSKKQLKDLIAYHMAFPNVKVIGGRYINGDLSTQFGKAYNLVCDLWQDRNDFYKESDRLKHLLGGNFSIKLDSQMRNFRFDESIAFGGEELAYLKAIQKKGLRVMLVNGLPVFHHANHDMIRFFSRAWLHGSRKYDLEKESFGSVMKDRKLLFDKKKPVAQNGMAGLYLGIVQAAYYKEALGRELSQAIEEKFKRLLPRSL